jgi:hypothetical protein
MDLENKDGTVQWMVLEKALVEGYDRLTSFLKRSHYHLEKVSLFKES